MMKKYILPVLFCLSVSGCRNDADINDINTKNYISPLEIYYFTSPAAGDVWKAGEIMNIKWTASDYTNYIDIYIIKKKQYYERIIAKNIPNTGSFAWGIPMDIPYSNHYQIKINQNGKVFEAGYSDVFTIRE